MEQALLDKQGNQVQCLGRCPDQYDNGGVKEIDPGGDVADSMTGRTLPGQHKLIEKDHDRKQAKIHAVVPRPSKMAQQKGFGRHSKQRETKACGGFRTIDSRHRGSGGQQSAQDKKGRRKKQSVSRIGKELEPALIQGNTKGGKRYRRTARDAERRPG